MGGWASCSCSRSDDTLPSAHRRPESQPEQVDAPVSQPEPTEPRAPVPAAIDTSKPVKPSRQVSIPNTPVGKDKDVFKYFCPICFMHFLEIYKSNCCGNYVCEECGSAHIQRKMKLSEPLDTIPDQVLAGVSCPSCLTDDVRFVLVQASEALRTYQESPHTKKLLAAAEARVGGPAARDLDTLKKKMLDFEHSVTDGGTTIHEHATATAAAATGMSSTTASLPPRPPRAGGGHAANGNRFGATSSGRITVPPVAPLPTDGEDNADTEDAAEAPVSPSEAATEAAAEAAAAAAIEAVEAAAAAVEAVAPPPVSTGEEGLLTSRSSAGDEQKTDRTRRVVVVEPVVDPQPQPQPHRTVAVVTVQTSSVSVALNTPQQEMASPVSAASAP